MIADAAVQLGVTPSQLLWVYKPVFADGVTGWTTAFSGTGAGVSDPTSAGFSNAIGQAFGKGSSNGVCLYTATNAGMLLASSTFKYYMRSRLKIPGHTNTMKAGMGIGSTSFNGSCFGLNGAITQNNFSAVTGANSITSATGYDDNPHDHAFWRDGIAGNYRVDSGAVGQNNNVGAPGNALHTYLIGISDSNNTANFCIVEDFFFAAVLQ
jgi:hypothetical protein